MGVLLELFPTKAVLKHETGDIHVSSYGCLVGWLVGWMDGWMVGIAIGLLATDILSPS